MIEFGADLHGHGFARRKEFLITAGNAYCSSSLAGNTRKYHGLIVADRRVYLSYFDEHANGKRISVARFAGALLDGGLRALSGFELYPPRFYYSVEGASIRKSIEFDGKLAVRYDVSGEADLCLRPLLTDRGYHETKKDVSVAQQSFGHGFTAGKLTAWSNLPFIEDKQVFYDVWYERDEERGYDHVENLYSPGFFRGTVRDDQAFVGASVEGVAEEPPGRTPPAGAIGSLEMAADSFLVDGSVYAGYHWFAEPWGRDTFVSLPGLLLERGRFDEAKRIFRHFAGLMKNGLIPNRIPGGYGSSDAPLWLVYALGRFFEKAEDRAFYREAKGYVEKILAGYPRSGVASLDGALIAVEPETTWMDTRYTPRKGKPVEVNALWVNALRMAEEMGLEPPVEPSVAIKEFEAFWNEEKGCLYDVVDPYDDSVRPNQAIAIALGVVDENKAKSAMASIRKELLAPYGLRTLSPKDRGYVGKFRGDASYHNGCVWPWLIGFYIEAALRLGEPKDRLSQLLEPLLLHTHDAGLGTISEIFDGDAPHEPNGCISQAWSVAEVLRAHNMLK